MKWIWQTLVMSISSLIANYAVAVTYGPSLVSLTKYNKDVHGPTLFHPETGRLLHLGDYPNFSVTVPLASDSPTATSNQVFISRRISGPGEFLVEAPPGHGVMAVIQSMDFRKASKGCNDFIQFGELDGVETTGTCGKVENRDGSVSPSSLVGPRVFRSSSGKMRVLFYHGYIWGLVRDFNFDLLDPSRNPVLRVEIVFTAYKECDIYKTPDIEYRPCSNSLYSTTCIPSGLFCDQVINCGFDQDFGSDELISNCYPHIYNTFLTPNANNLQVFPVSSFPTSASVVDPNTSPVITEVSSAPVPTTTTVASTTTTSSTTTTGPPPTTTATPTTASTLPTTTVPSTTTTSPTTTTTTPSPAIERSTTTTTVIPTTLKSEGTESSFTQKLRQHIFSTTNRSPINTTTTPNSIATLRTTTVELQREGPTTTRTRKPYRQPSSSPPPDPETRRGKSFDLDLQQPKENMTFSENNELSVDVGEEKVELLQEAPTISEDSSDLLELDEESGSGLVIGFGVLTLFVIGLIICVRICCCRNKVIWVPNPNNIRRRRKRGSSVYETETGCGLESDDATNKKPNLPKSRKETPPSYDVLFPNPKEQKAEADDASMY